MLVLVLVLPIACSNGEQHTGSEATAGTSTSGGVAFDPGSPHTPTTGCHEGYVVCGDVCAHVADARHCGKCNNLCNYMPDGGACVAGECTPGGSCCEIGASCGGVCMSLTRNANHCGSCDNRCADDALCYDNTCTGGGGDGTSCSAALAWNNGAAEDVGFRMSAALSMNHKFQCGPPESIPTRWFRITAPQDDAEVRVRALADGDFVLEVFSAMMCDGAAFVGCSDDYGSGTDPRLQGFFAPTGTTYWVAVGIKGAASGQPAVIEVDN